MAVPLARRNLTAEKGRLAISISGVALAVMLILIVLALYRGWSRAGEVFEELPGQLWVVQHGTSDPFHSVSLLTTADLASVQDTGGVATVVPVLSRQMTVHVGGSDSSVRLMALGPPATEIVQDDRFLPASGDIVIDRVFSRKTGLEEGDTLALGGQILTVSRVVPPGGDVLSQFAFVSFDDATKIFGVEGVVNYGMVILAKDADTGAVSEAIAAENPGLTVYTAQGFAESVRKEIDESFIPIILILVVIGFIVGSAVVGLTIYTATIERAREFGVIKALGASSAFLYRLVLAQSITLTAAGFAAGVAAAMLTARLAEQSVPEFATDFRLSDVGFVLLAALIMAFIASMMPVRRINSIDPATVFRA
jgi:putative ABC transport system permease protein